MPIYEYKCRNCGKIVEVFQKTLSQKKVDCHHCGASNMEKIFSVPAVMKAANPSSSGTTCCGREERCDTPPCSVGEGCRRDRQ